MKTKCSTITLLALFGLAALILFLPERSPVLEASDTVPDDVFTKRLQIAANDEAAIAASLIENFTSTDGRRLEVLDPSHQDLLTLLSFKQDDIRNELRSFQTDLINYLSKMRNERYEKVLHAIQRSEVDDGLAMVKELIIKNQSYSAAAEAQVWAEQFRHWEGQMRGANIYNLKPAQQAVDGNPR